MRKIVCVDIYVLNDNNEAIWKNSNKTGILEVYLLPGESYSVYAEDKNERYLPRQSKVIMGEEDKEIVLYLSTNDTVKGKVTASEMTYGEIKEAGIDMDCDDNQRIIKYEVTLVYLVLKHLKHQMCVVGKFIQKRFQVT